MTRHAARLSEIRLMLGCSTTERTTHALARLLAERDALRLKVRDLEKALAEAWRGQDQSSERAAE